MVQPPWKAICRFLKKLEYDPAVPLWEIIPQKLKARSQGGICTPMLKAALFAVGKKWMQLKCPLRDE